MRSRFLTAGLAAAMVVGLAAEAPAQSGGRSAPARPDRPSESAPPSATAPEATPGTTEDAGSQDAFDQAAARATDSGDSPGTSPKLEKATFGAGCFWHVEHEFEWLRGVKSAVSGYAGGHVANPSYEMVHEGDTGHAEVVQVEYDPSVISYEELLKVFWNIHDPTQVGGQGPDIGPQYRSVIFYHNDEQRKAALKSYRDLTAARVFRGRIVTQLVPIGRFYRAEEYHQNYYGGKPDRPVARRPRTRRAAGKRAGAAKPAGSPGKPAPAPADSTGGRPDGGP